MKPNGLVEDLGAIMGATATFRLVAVFGSGTLYIPAVADAEHPIGRVIGHTAFRHLVAACGGETLDLPAGDEFMRLRKMRRVVRLLSDGVRIDEVARQLGCTPRHVRNYGNQGAALGLSGRRLPKD